MKKISKPHKLADAAAVFATLVGTFKVIGILSGIWIFTQIGETFAISPSPAPYSSISTRAAEDLTGGLLFGCEDKSGDITWGKWNYIIRAQVPGPHRRGVSFLAYFRLAGRENKSVDERRRFNTLTRYYFCEDQTLTRAAHCNPNPDAVLFKLVKVTGGQAVMDMRIPCTL